MHKKPPQSERRATLGGAKLVQLIAFDEQADPNANTGTVGGNLSGSDEVIFLRLPQVKVVTGLSKTSLYELIRDRDFPAPVPLGPRAVGWVRSEVNQWAADRIRASRSVPYQASRKTA